MLHHFSWSFRSLKSPILAEDDEDSDDDLASASSASNVAKSSAGDDGIDMKKNPASKPITRSDESRRKRRDLTEQLGEEEKKPKAEEVVEVKKLTKEEVDKALEERDVTVNDDGQYVDAQGVSRPHA